MKRILIIDQMNMFIRNWIVNPTLSIHGHPVGGLMGSLKSLQKVTRETHPDVIVIVWDGEGGSKKRRAMQSEYKFGRKPLRKNYETPGMSEEEEKENRNWQVIRLMEYFNHTPVIQLIYNDIEADDVISFLTQCSTYANDTKIIVSSDQDYLQLLNDKTLLYKPIQEQFLNVKRTVEQYGVHPNNFALAKALTGDRSDNVEGVKGLGIKTLVKNFPQLSLEKSITLKDFIEDASKKTGKVLERIVEARTQIESNYKIVQLYSPLISVQKMQHITNVIDNFVPTMSRTELRVMFNKDGTSEVTISELLKYFEIMVNKYKSC